MRNLEISPRNIKTFRYFTHDFFLKLSVYLRTFSNVSKK